jgi:hypothetical protein
MKLSSIALLLIAAPAASTASKTSSLISCLLNTDPSSYSSCCTDDKEASSPICTYLACEMGELPPDQCSCSTFTSFCNEVQHAEKDGVIVPQICAPSLECCTVDESTGEASVNEDFQSCMAEKAGEIEPTSFLELNSHLVEKKEEEPVVGAVKEESSGSHRVGGVSFVIATFATGAVVQLL